MIHSLCMRSSPCPMTDTSPVFRSSQLGQLFAASATCGPLEPSALGGPLSRPVILCARARLLLRVSRTQGSPGPGTVFSASSEILSKELAVGRLPLSPHCWT